MFLKNAVFRVLDPPPTKEWPFRPRHPLLVKKIWKAHYLIYIGTVRSPFFWLRIFLALFGTRPDIELDSFVLGRSLCSFWSLGFPCHLLFLACPWVCLLWERIVVCFGTLTSPDHKRKPGYRSMVCPPVNYPFVFLHKHNCVPCDIISLQDILLVYSVTCHPRGEFEARVTGESNFSLFSFTRPHHRRRPGDRKGDC